jgi:agmatinase
MDLQKLGMSPYGPATFAKSELVKLASDWSADVVFLGVPFDLGVGFRPGARWGPKAIRDMSVRFGAMGAGAAGFFDLRTRRTKGICRFVDAGDLEMLPLDWEQNFARITEAVAQIRERGALPFVLGGDHAVTFPVLRGFTGQEPITVVHIDAHFDYRDEVMGVRHAHGNVLRRVRELPFVKRIVSIGVRSLRTRREDFEDFERDGNACVPAWDIHEKGLGALRAAIPSGESIYLTFDIDGVDPSIAPGTGTPEMGGLDFEQARSCLELACTRNRLVGFDLVEVNPYFDPSHITGLLAAQLIVEVLGFVFDR